MSASLRFGSQDVDVTMFYPRLFVSPPSSLRVEPTDMFSVLSFCAMSSRRVDVMSCVTARSGIEGVRCLVDSADMFGTGVRVRYDCPDVWILSFD